MNICKTSLVTALLLAAAALPLRARVVYDTGPCPGGGTWIIVTTIDDRSGRVTSMRGTNCEGTIWKDHCPIMILPRDPNHRGAFEHTGQSGDWIRFNVDDNGNITGMWGRDADGIFWEKTVMTIW